MADSTARAGMDPPQIGQIVRFGSFPRTRGDGPKFAICKLSVALLPPHSRGWTIGEQRNWPNLASFSANPPTHDELAGMDPFPTWEFQVSPALAGMDLRYHYPIRCSNRFPRTRGDGPRANESQGREENKFVRRGRWRVLRADRRGARVTPPDPSCRAAFSSSDP